MQSRAEPPTQRERTLVELRAEQRRLLGAVPMEFTEAVAFEGPVPALRDPLEAEIVLRRAAEAVLGTSVRAHLARRADAAAAAEAVRVASTVTGRHLDGARERVVARLASVHPPEPDADPDTELNQRILDFAALAVAADRLVADSP